jgi:ketosteroid isomerase-like protein
MTQVDPNEAIRLAELWDKTSREHDLKGFAALLAPDFQMRYNFDPAPRSREQLLGSLQEVYDNFQEHGHEDAQITATARGFVTQATLTGRLFGTRISVPFCLVAEIKSGKVHRAFEYFDTAALPKRVGPPGEGMVEVRSH